MDVLVDTRERADEVVVVIKESGCRVVKTTLDAGDYVAGGFLFERKSASDFIASITDGRLFEQVLTMKKVDGLRPAVIVEGDVWRELKFRKIHPNSILGATLALAKLGVAIIYTRDPRQTGSLLCLAAKKEGGGVKVPKVKKDADLYTLQIALLASLPGIGPKRAEELLAKYETPLEALMRYREWEVDEKTKIMVERVLTARGEKKMG